MSRGGWILQNESCDSTMGGAAAFVKALVIRLHCRPRVARSTPGMSFKIPILDIGATLFGIL